MLMLIPSRMYVPNVLAGAKDIISKLQEHFLNIRVFPILEYEIVQVRLGLRIEGTLILKLTIVKIL